MKVVIIDGEKEMHFMMERMLAKFEDVEVVGSFTEKAAAFSYLANHEVELA